MLLDVNFTPYVPTTLLGLLGLISGYLYFYFKNKDDNKLKGIQSTSQEERLKAIEINLTELGIPIDTQELTPTDRYNLLVSTLNAKTRKYLILSSVLVILSFIVAFLIYDNNHQPPHPDPYIKTHDIFFKNKQLRKNITYTYVEFEGEAIDCLLDSQKINSLWRDWFDTEPIIGSNITSVFDTLSELKNKFNVRVSKSSLGLEPTGSYILFDDYNLKFNIKNSIPNSKISKFKNRKFNQILAGTNPNMSGEFSFYSTEKFVKENFHILLPQKNTSKNINFFFNKITFDIFYNESKEVVPSEGTNEYAFKTLDLYKYVTAHNLPRGFIEVESNPTPDCVFPEGETTCLFTYTTPVLKVGIVAVKNNNSVPIEIENFVLKTSNLDSLRSFSIDYNMAKEKIKIPFLVKLMPNETLLIPMYIYFHPVSKFKSHFERIDKNAYSSIAEGWIYNRSYYLDSITVEDETYSPIKQELSAKVSIAYKGIIYEIGGSCPYVYSKTGHNDFKKAGTILYLLNSKNKKNWDTLELKSFDGFVKVKEEEDEVSYIDNLLILEKTSTHENIIHKTNDSIVSKVDGKMRILRKKDQLLLNFGIFSPNNQSLFYLIGYGYYLPIKIGKRRQRI